MLLSHIVFLWWAATVSDDQAAVSLWSPLLVLPNPPFLQLRTSPAHTPSPHTHPRFSNPHPSSSLLHVIHPCFTYYHSSNSSTFPSHPHSPPTTSLLVHIPPSEQQCRLIRVLTRYRLIKNYYRTETGFCNSTIGFLTSKLHLKVSTIVTMCVVVIT